MSICNCSAACAYMDTQITALTATITALTNAIDGLSDGAAKDALVARRDTLSAEVSVITFVKTQRESACSTSHALDATQTANYNEIVSLDGGYETPMKRLHVQGRLIALLDEYDSVKVETTEIRDLFLDSLLVKSQ